MDDSIMNVEQAVDFLGISEKTLIKLLREEHIPARKIGREWRFSKAALIEWLAAGDSLRYIGRNDSYQVSADEKGETAALLERVKAEIGALQSSRSLNQLLELDHPIEMPGNATLRISYKQQRDVEKLEFKIYWLMRGDSRMDPVQEDREPSGGRANDEEG